ncbi:MAG: cytochrome c-type biogenesis protein CcmH [Acidobacteria bacterium]|nr:cytochrome c-type biogenesis protein CcmH [Acidobacteriota bacterium]
MRESFRAKSHCLRWPMVLFCAWVGLAGGTLSGRAQGDIAVAPPSLVVGEPAGEPLSGAGLDAETERIGSLVRCPVCQGLSVTDSPAPMALKMKQQVRDLIAEGYTERQILSYFERSYGEFVLLSPPLRGMNWIVWLAPVFLLAVGLAVLTWFFRRSGASGDVPLPEAGESEASPANAVDPYVREARRLAYGDSEETGR